MKSFCRNCLASNLFAMNLLVMNLFVVKKLCVYAHQFKYHLLPL
jgi:hypothetical protein